MELNQAEILLNDYLKEKNDLSPVDIVENLKDIKKDNEESYIKFLNRLDIESLGKAAKEMPDHMLKDIIEIIPDVKIIQALEDLESDDATDLIQRIREIDIIKAKELFSFLEKDSQKDISRLINYDEEVAGAYMQVELFAAHLDEKLSNTIKRFRIMKKSGEIENIFQLFVIDTDNILHYVLPLDDLLMYDGDVCIKDIVAHSPNDYKAHYVYDTEDMDEVIQVVKDYDLSTVAVVNEAKVLLGRITTDDMHDYMEESATEQIYNLAGVDDDAEDEDDVKEVGKSRAIWLFVNLITALISSYIIGLFDSTIEAFVALAILMPIVASMGGNTGTQALTVTVRKLATGKIEFDDAKDVLLKETGIAMINGTIFASCMGVIAYIWFDKPMLGLVIWAAMFINLSMAGFFGTLIPMTLKRLDIDPAVGSSVLLTTVTDAVGFLSFLGLASLVLVK